MNGESDGQPPVDNNGMLSVSFIEQLNLKARVLAGAPSLLELSIISRGLRIHSSQATFDLFEEDGSLFSSVTDVPSVPTLVNLMHAKFSKAALITSLSSSEIAYFDYSNEYFIFLGREKEIDIIFNLDRSQIFDYFNDNLETGLDVPYLKSIWSIYEPFM